LHREFLEGDTGFVDAASLSDEGAKTERLLHILQQVGATDYLSGPSATDYIDEAAFEEAGIALSWADYSGYEPYPQLHGEFDPAVSVLDLLFMCGPEAREHVRLRHG